MQPLWSTVATVEGASYVPFAPLTTRTITFLRPPPGPTTTSSSLMGWRAQKGSGVFFVRVSGALPVNFTLPAISPLPCAPGPPAVGPLPAGAAGAGRAAASFFLQPSVPAVRARASETNVIVEEKRDESGRGMAWGLAGGVGPVKATRRPRPSHQPRNSVSAAPERRAARRPAPRCPRGPA